MLRITSKTDHSYRLISSSQTFREVMDITSSDHVEGVRLPIRSEQIYWLSEQSASRSYRSSPMNRRFDNLIEVKA